MQQLVYTLRLDMKDTGIINTGLRLKQGDSGMKIVVNVYNGGQNAFDAGSTPKIVFRRPDGASVQADMTVEASSYSYVLVGNELQVPGKELMDVKFTINSDDRESTITCCFDVVADTITPNTGGSGIYDNDLAQIITEVEADAQAAEESAEDAEAWAVGERNGVPVTSGDETYENNAKYWANQANPTALANMSDVDITSPTDNQVLIYDANSGMWVNGATSGSGDMEKSVYDSASTVENAGGIVAYVASQIPTVDQVYDGTSANAQSGVAIASVVGSWTTAVTAALGATTVTISDADILTTSIIDIYTENSSNTEPNITGKTISSGQLVLTFDALAEATDFKLHIY